jgi:nucleoside-diphosphate-sugar epimerase
MSITGPAEADWQDGNCAGGRPGLVVFGLGFAGTAVARHFLRAGWRVTGTTRSGALRPDWAEDLPEAPVFAFDRDHALPEDALAGATHVLAGIPPDEAGDPVLDRLADRLRRLAPRWVGYFSTTGVYGDRGGDRVDETADVRPASARARWRVAAERAWLDSGLPVHVFRLAGIYGPGRSAFTQIRAGTARRVIKPGQVFGRIHVADIARVVAASIARPNPGAIYNVADDLPAPPQDVIELACRLLGAPVPPALSWEQAQTLLSPMALSFFADNKRIDNGRIKRELGVTLAYPSYREGLVALLGEKGLMGR